MAAMLVVIVLQGVSVSRIKSERNRYKENTRTLLVDVKGTGLVAEVVGIEEIPARR